MGLFTGYIGAKCRRYTARRDAITNANCARILAGWKACEAAKEPEPKVIPSLGQMVGEIEEKEKRKLEKEEEERQRQIQAAKEREERMRNEKTEVTRVPFKVLKMELIAALAQLDKAELESIFGPDPATEAAQAQATTTS